MRIIKLILIILLLSPFVPPVDAGRGLTHFPLPNSSIGEGAGITSEEENIDSFDVSPASGRWNVTSDDLTDDLVTDSILRMTTVNNETSDSAGFAMDRGMSKTDGKVEYRMAASGGGNQTEFFRDVVGDKSDFEEGDIENWKGLVGMSASESVLTAKMAAAIFDRMFITILPNASTVIYHTFKMKIKPNVDDLNVRFRVSVAEGDSTFSTIDTLDLEWQIITWLREDNAFWQEFQTFTSLGLQFDEVGGDGTLEATDSIQIDWIELIGDFDYATFVEGEIEDTWDWEVDNDTESFTGLDNMNVSEGFLRGTMAAGIADIFVSPAGLSIDTSLFEILKVRMNTSDVTMDFIIEADLGAGIVIVSSPIDLDSTSQTVYEIDLSDDSDWSGTCIKIQIRFDELDDTLDGDEIVFIDYVLLLGHWADSDSVIGLWDQDDLVPLLNVSSHFTSNNSHPTTSDKAYFTVELLDLDGEVSYSAISDNYTDVSDSWIQGKITYDVLRSRLVVTINWDNITRIDKWNFPADFTEVSGRIPALFSHEIPPHVFTSTFCVATSWQEMKLGHIKADYNERRWRQEDIPTDKDFLTDSRFGCYAQDDIDDSSGYSLIVPYFDAVSGIMGLNFTNPANLTDGDFGSITFILYGVDANDGDSHIIFSFGLVLANQNPFGNIVGLEINTGGETLISLQKLGNFNPKFSFSIATINDRSEAELLARFWPSTFIENLFFDYAANVTILDEVDDPSQEFILRIDYTADFDGDVELTAVIEDFDFLRRESFAGISPGVATPGIQRNPIKSSGGALDPLSILFNTLGSIFKVAGDLIVGSILVMQTAVTSALATVTIAINQIQGWLTTLGATITGAIANIEGWLNTIAAAITGAIADIEGWLNTIAAAITGAIANIEGWLNTIASTISDAIADIAADIWTAFGTAAAGIMDDIITALIGLASDVADFIDGIIQFLIPLLLAIAADLADLFVGILDALITIGGDILAGIINFIAGVTFFIWEALGLPDILAVFALFITPIVEIVTGLPGYVTEIGDLIAIFFIVILGIYWFWLIFLAFAEKGFDIFAGFGESVSRLFTFWNLSILGFGPIPIPIALFFIPLTYFFIVPDGSVFAIW